MINQVPVTYKIALYSTCTCTIILFLSSNLRCFSSPSLNSTLSSPIFAVKGVSHRLQVNSILIFTAFGYRHLPSIIPLWTGRRGPGVSRFGVTSRQAGFETPRSRGRRREGHVGWGLS